MKKEWRIKQPMKRSCSRLVIAISFIFLMFIFCGCGKKGEALPEITYLPEIKEPVEEKDNSTSEEKVFKNAITTDSENVKAAYISEVMKRLMSADGFMKEEEVEYFSKKGYEVTDSIGGLLYKESNHYYFCNYYPIMMKIPEFSEGLVMVYTTDAGRIICSDFYGGRNVGWLHYDEAEIPQDVVFVESDIATSLIYFPEERIVRAYKFGEVLAECQVSGKYCGTSGFVGVLFRDGSNVYAMNYDYTSSIFEVHLIATDVSQVVEASYKYSSRYWDRPLFLMEDGTVKVYLGLDVRDDPSSKNALYDPIKEGGYQSLG